VRIELHTLGGLELRASDGVELPVEVFQPKRLALLAYLALASPPGFHNRDMLLALLWPELDEARGRNALSQAIHWLRRGLGQEALLARGKGRVAVSEERVWCDARYFERALEAGHFETALALYKGDLLSGFHLPGPGDFEIWVEAERKRFRRQAHEAAGALADEAEAAGNPVEAVRCLRRQLAITPLDEGVLRRLIGLLARAGDRAGATGEYEAFERMLSREYDLEPAQETRALIDAVRSGTWAALVPDSASNPVIGQVRHVPAAPEAIRSLAVLPLENLSGDPEQDYFADGMTDALITELGKVSALRVISRQSVMPFRSSRQSLPEVARALEVDAVVEGTVLREGGDIRIIVQLIRTDPEMHLWAESYERPLVDVLALQSEIARTVALEVRAALTPEEASRLAQTRSVDPAAYEAYLRGRHFQHVQMGREIALAIRYFRDATEIDPAYAPAHAGLAICYCTLAIFANLPRDQALPAAAAAAGTAVTLDDSLAEAHVALAYTVALFHWDWAAADRACRRALELNPGSVDAHAYYAGYLTWVGRFGEAVAEGKQTLSLAPLDVGAHWLMGWIYHKAGRHQEAIRELEAALEFYPSFAFVHPFLGASRLLSGNPSRAVADVDAGLAILPEDQLSLGYGAWTLAGAGEREAALGLLQRLRALGESRWVDPYYVGVAQLGLGDGQAALDWLERSYAERSPSTLHLRSDPLLAALRRERRFRKLMQRLSFPST
jgi:TolB-like protein/DNA-binding SARP family transcriptional activator